MQSQHSFDELYPGRPVFQSREHQIDVGSSTGSRRHAAAEAHLSPPPPSGAGQAEWAVMHPDHHDLEWHYCRGRWAG
jgi:hypothetical protein